jgi:hypothetical protein
MRLISGMPGSRLYERSGSSGFASAFTQPPSFDFSTSVTQREPNRFADEYSYLDADWNSDEHTIGRAFTIRFAYSLVERDICSADIKIASSHLCSIFINSDCGFNLCFA